MAKSRFEMVRDFFRKGLWDARRVRDAVDAGWITEEQCAQILDEGSAEA